MRRKKERKKNEKKRKKEKACHPFSLASFYLNSDVARLPHCRQDYPPFSAVHFDLARPLWQRRKFFSFFSFKLGHSYSACLSGRDKEKRANKVRKLWHSGLSVIARFCADFPFEMSREIVSSAFFPPSRLRTARS